MTLINKKNSFNQTIKRVYGFTDQKLCRLLAVFRAKIYGTFFAPESAKKHAQIRFKNGSKSRCFSQTVKTISEMHLHTPNT